MSNLLIGDVREVLPTLDAQSVQMCVTSPPYWGLRDYGVDGQLGLEATPEEYVENMVGVFREVRRVLKNDGTLWLNLGDSYARDEKKGQHKPGDSGKQSYVYDNGGGRASACTRLKKNSQTGQTIRGHSRRLEAGQEDNELLLMERGQLDISLKPKDLIGIPWRVAFALQADGWYLRQDIIWHKPNPMPESVKDRCTKAHEYLFLLSKRERYYFDAEAIKEPVSPKTLTVNTTPRKGQGTESTGEKLNKWMEEHGGRYHPEKANKRSVWTVTSQPYADAHFATFPPKLIEPCVLAGSRPGDTVLDPFFGSGTTGEVCEHLGRQWLGIEINPEYGEMAKRRTAQRGLDLGYPCA